jgi:hypothetical protein
MSLLNSAYKICSTIIKAKEWSLVDLVWMQYLQYNKYQRQGECNLTLLPLFLDCEKAYYRVNQTRLCTTLSGYITYLHISQMLLNPSMITQVL